MYIQNFMRLPVVHLIENGNQQVHFMESPLFKRSNHPNLVARKLSKQNFSQKIDFLLEFAYHFAENAIEF